LQNVQIRLHATSSVIHSWTLILRTNMYTTKLTRVSTSNSSRLYSPFPSILVSGFAYRCEVYIPERNLRAAIPAIFVRRLPISTQVLLFASILEFKLRSYIYFSILSANDTVILVHMLMQLHIL